MGEPNKLMESFLPTRLLRRVFSTEGKRPALIKLNGSVLTIDVSRYTALVEQLARRGQPGFEEISRLLSVSYTSCVEQIMSQGGEILHFTGDSIVAYWLAEKLSEASAVKCAMSCVSSIFRDRHDNSELTSVNEDLVFHAGIGSGDFWAATVGGNPDWNLVVGGDAIVQALNAGSIAQSGEFLLSDKANEALANEAISTNVELGPDNEIILAFPSDDWFGSFLPPQLLEIIFTAEVTPNIASNLVNLNNQMEVKKETQLDVMSEIRPISALFVRIIGISFDRADSLNTLQSLIVKIQEIVRERGGPAGEWNFDDKGLNFFAAFGRPGAFHRDDPRRAVETAQAIYTMVDSLELNASVGIATGDALFRIVGNTNRRQLMVLGQPVNRAARLMNESFQSVLCDSSTERASRTAFSFKKHGTLQLLGLGEVVSVFQPLMQYPVIKTETSLIGRHAEMQNLRRAFELVKDGTNQLMMLIGEPGIGKTALVNAFEDELRASCFTVSVARAERDDRRTSMLAWRRVLETLVDLPVNSDGLIVFQSIRSRLDDFVDILPRLPLLADVLVIDVTQTESTRHLNGGHRADATMRFLGEIIGILAPRPLTIVLEDSQWLDSASWRLVEWMLGSLRSIMVVLCARTGEIPEEIKNFRRRAEGLRNGQISKPDDPARFYQELELVEMGDESIHQLVSNTLGGVPPHLEIAHKITTLAGGNPFFAEEIALSLKSEGLIAVRDGYWRSIQPLQEAMYFEGVEKVIRERVDNLDLASQNVLKVASVVGRSFNIMAINFIQSNEVNPIVDHLLEYQLIRTGSQPGEYEFRHDQIRDVVYNLIPSGLRRELHSKMAKWIKITDPNDFGANIAVLVQHFEAASEFAQVVKYADIAATNALQIGAFREVEFFIGNCLKHESLNQNLNVVDKLKPVRWYRQLAEAHYGRGDIHAQGVAIQKALELVGKPMPNSSTAIWFRLIANGIALIIQQAFLPSLKIIDQTDFVKREIETARCLSQAGTVDYFELRFERGMCSLLSSLLHAERAGVTVDTAIACCQLGCGMGIMRWRSMSIRLMRRAEQIAIRLDDPSTYSHVNCLDALWRIGFCEWKLVEQRVDQAQNLALRAGDQMRWCNAQVIRFWSEYYQGEHSTLEKTADALLSRAQNAGNIQQEVWGLQSKALCAILIDRPREAIDLLRQTSSAMPGSVDPSAQTLSYGMLALAFSRVGKQTESYDAVNETLRLLEEMKRPTSHALIVGITSVLEVLLRGREEGILSRNEDSLTKEKVALKHLKRHCKAFDLGEAQLGLWIGLEAWLDGRRDHAIFVWQKALIKAKKFSLRKDEYLIAAEIRRREGMRNSPNTEKHLQTGI